MTTATITTLKEFAVEYGDRYFYVTTIPSVGSPSYYGSTFKDEWLRDPATGEPSGVEDFKMNKDGCEFGIGYELYILKLDRYPQDKWGNTATQESGLKLKKGYWEVFWDDEGYSEFDDDFIYPDWLFEYEDYETEFRNWFLENYQNYSFLSAIEEENTFGGTANSWLAITTNKPFNSRGWLGLFEDFRKEVYE